MEGDIKSLVPANVRPRSNVASFQNIQQWMTDITDESDKKQPKSDSHATSLEFYKL